MKKTTAHGRKLKRMGAGFNGVGAGFNGVEWINAISRCQPYTDELIPGAIGTTQASADKSIALVADAYRAMRSPATHRPTMPMTSTAWRMPWESRNSGPRKSAAKRNRP